MYRFLLHAVQQGLAKQVPATGLGLFRIFFALVALQEILFLYHFRHLIFDPLPYLDPASPSIHLFLVFWAIAALFLALGYRTRSAAAANYLFWLVFTVFTPMWKDFDGGFDQLMLGSSFLLIFLPSERALSLDNLRLKWLLSTPGRRYAPPASVSVLAYFIPLAVSLGLIYLDSAIHKLSAEFWRHGLGPWLPSSLPYYMSPLDLSWLLNIEPLQKLIGYGILVFQFLFIFLFYFRPFRVPLLAVGASLHAGIIVSLNIYPFGFGMLVHYFLLVPFAWWRCIGARLRAARPTLTVLYDQLCPLCNRTVIFVEHFDVRKAIAFRGLQTHARSYVQLADVPDAELLKDLYAIDDRGRRYSGVDTYLRILRHMGYTAPLALILMLPGIYHLARATYRRIADNRAREVCDDSCAGLPDRAEKPLPPLGGLLQRLAATERQQAKRIAKSLILVLVLQLNCTLHYGILYRLGFDPKSSEAGAVLAAVSNGLIGFSHTFLGITPHPLYLHDHFEGYNHILALTYRDADGRERWLPFIDEQGRMTSPNWGRVHSMWANAAVTRRIDHRRLGKFVAKVTAFYAKP
ncbi:MAG: DCC1-like thiol-disulfide oxidoreductase family protein, partial [Methylotetracoccus sp.]|nr:DCC1-like thiol-disulfide oxidoreductase family protein [Methylotetracoccus sp.]